MPTESPRSRDVPLRNGHPTSNGAGLRAVALTDELLLVDRTEFDGADIVVISFNRPDQRNPIDKDTIAALSELLDTLASSAQAPDAIVLTGNGTTFSAGGDLKGYQSLYRDPVRFRRFMEDFDAACAKLAAIPSLTVAMINGTCVAGGLELSLACDLITISESARIGDGHLRFGQLPGAGGSQRLVRAIGVQQAKKWLLTAELFDAATAHAAGLTALVAPAAELRSRTFELVARAAKLTPLGRARMKQLITIAQTTPLDEGLRQEMDIVFTYATTSHDATEGLNSFAERREAHYRGH